MERISLSGQLRWIGIPDGDRADGRIQTAWFFLRLEGVALKPCRIALSALSRYRLYINGELIGYGPCRGDFTRQYFDEYDLAPYLVTDENVIAVKVVAFPPRERAEPGHMGPIWSMDRGGGPALALEGADLSTGVADWRVAVTGEMTPFENRIAPWLGYSERVDGVACISVNDVFKRAHPPARTLWAATENAWGEQPPFQAFRRPVPLTRIGPMERLSKFARNTGAAFDTDGMLSVPANARAVVELDAERLCTALLALRCVGGRGGQIDICYAESYLTTDERGEHCKDDRLPGPTSVLEGHSDQLTLGDGELVYEPFLMRVFRYVRLTIQAGSEPLTVHAPCIRTIHYPLDVRSSVGASSAAWVRDVWALSLNTLQNCMHETYEDCPYYEQMQYAMDTGLQMLFTYRVSGDVRLARRALRDFRCSQLPDGLLQSRYPSAVPQLVPSFSLHFAFMLEDYYWQTGDIDLVAECMGALEGVLGYFKRNTRDGLAEHLGHWQFVDWTDEWENGVPPACAEGPESAHNFQYAAAQQAAARLARALGWEDRAREYERDAEGVIRALQSRCYDPERGLFRDGPSGGQFSQHAQVWAVLAGAGDAAFRRNLMERMLADKSLVCCSFPLQFYLFRALERVGLYHKTESLWALWKRLLEQHLTTIPETPDNPRSDCHAWGALMLSEFQDAMLGVRPLLPGYARIEIRPLALFLGQASGRATLPSGTMDIGWRLTGERLELDVTSNLPESVPARLPDGSERTICPGECLRFGQRVSHCSQ